MRPTRASARRSPPAEAQCASPAGSKSAVNPRPTAAPRSSACAPTRFGARVEPTKDSIHPPVVSMSTFRNVPSAVAACLIVVAAADAGAAPTVSRLTPPSELFASGNVAGPYIARFLPGQRFDLQATVRLDAGTTLKDFSFLVDGAPTHPSPGTTSVVTTGLTLPKDVNAAVVSQRAFSVARPGVHKLTVRATQSDGQSVSADGNFEVVAMGREGRPAKNIVILLGDGMGAAHRTAARIMGRGYAQGKAQGRMAMDTFPVTGMVMTSSLDGIVTDSSPG